LASLEHGGDCAVQNTESNWQLIEENGRFLAQLHTALDLVLKINSTLGKSNNGASAEYCHLTEEKF